ncbi:hypothetical protein EDB92DRAFT_1836179 [Lactarius akahatsu]|uniref:Homeobox domain-containing protein n=1 Tax=Lactarius akahatsu TaxID=416441 RepID=A0AAD4QBP2_9AGAM|nr:hypothetical protein EDB92DRAFT_1836179 [Lactarius akahatsu]
MSSCSRRPKPSSKRGESSLPVEDWQLRILWEWQQKQPPTHPSLEQRRSLAAQTGLNIKWISSWFKKANVVSKKKTGAAAKGAPSATPIVAAAAHESGSPKLEGLAEAIEPNSTRAPPSAGEDPFLLYHSDVGGNAVSECVRPSIARKNRSSIRELSGAADLALVPDSDLQTDRDHLVPYSSSHGARLVRVSESPSALLHSQRIVNSCGTGLSNEFASSLTHASSPSNLLLGSQPPSSCGSHTSHESIQIHATLGGSQSAVPVYPKHHDATHDSGPASAFLHHDCSVPTLVASQPSLVPLPSIYGLLFDRGEFSIGGHNSTLCGSLLSPPGGEPGVAAASSLASATPVSFLATWEDVLTLERSARSSFVRNLLRTRQAQSPDVILIGQSDHGASLTLMSSGRLSVKTSRRGLMRLFGLARTQRPNSSQACAI